MVVVVVVILVGLVQNQVAVIRGLAAFPRVVVVFNVIPAPLAALANVLALVPVPPAQTYAPLASVQAPAPTLAPVYVASL